MSLTTFDNPAPPFAEPKTPDSPGEPVFRWPLLAAVVLFLLAVILFWYHFDLHTRVFHGAIHFRATWLQPAFMALGTWFYVVVLRLTTGLRWRDLSRDTRFVMISAVALFSVLWWVGRSGFFQRNLAGLMPETAFTPLYGFLYFSINCFLFRTVAPLVLIKTRFKKKPRDFGYQFKGATDVWWVYLVLAAIVCLAVIFYASYQSAFQAKYPMCRRMMQGGQIPLWQFLVYQGFYGLIFVSGESFWRGYMAFGVRKDLGYMGLVWMIIPYTMAHFGKPMIETMGAMVTGMVLGSLALRHKSFWLGVAAHWGVALTMDLSAIWRRGIELTF